MDLWNAGSMLTTQGHSESLVGGPDAELSVDPLFGDVFEHAGQGVRSGRDRVRELRRPMLSDSFLVPVDEQVADGSADETTTSRRGDDEKMRTPTGVDPARASG